MADSPAKRHRARLEAEAAAAQKRPGELMDGAGAYEQHMMMLQTDRATLKSIQSAEKKAEYKRGILHAYGPYIDGVIASDSGAQDDVVVTVMVWAIDAGLYSEALGVAEYVLRHGLALPDRFSRTTGCLVAEEIAEAALVAEETSQDFPADVLARAMEITADHDMPDEVRAKLYLASARGLMRQVGDDANGADLARAEQAVAWLRRAIELHDKCGGKKDLERAERVLKKQTAIADSAGPKPGAAAGESS